MAESTIIFLQRGCMRKLGMNGRGRGSELDNYGK